MDICNRKDYVAHDEGRVFIQGCCAHCILSSANLGLTWVQNFCHCACDSFFVSTQEKELMLMITDNAFVDCTKEQHI